MAKKKKKVRSRKRGKKSGPPRDSGAHQRTKLGKMGLGCVVLLIVLFGVFLLPKMLEGAG